MMDIFLLCLNCSSRNLSIELSGLPSEGRVFVPSIGPAGLITDKIVQQYCIFEKEKKRLFNNRYKGLWVMCMN